MTKVKKKETRQLNPQPMPSSDVVDWNGPDGFDLLALQKDSIIIAESDVYPIELLGDVTLLPNDYEFENNVAYVDNGYYYIYRGQYKGSNKNTLKAGIYKNIPGASTPFFVIEPQTEEEIKTFKITPDNVASLHPVSIIDTINTKEELLVAIPESTKIFQPTLSALDDILKRAAKMALIAKNVDLDRYKDRFKDKNALFNFKQVIRGDNKLSILIFDRGMEALNLKYKIIIEEKDDINVVGMRLLEPIVVSSEDTFEY